MEEIIISKGDKIEYVQVKFDVLSFRQRLWLCWNILTRKIFGIRTSDVEIKRRNNDGRRANRPN